MYGVFSFLNEFFLKSRLAVFTSKYTIQTQINKPCLTLLQNLSKPAKKDTFQNLIFFVDKDNFHAL